MNIEQFDKLQPRDFENGAIIDEIRKVFQALEVTNRFNRIKNDKDAYLDDVYQWAIKNKTKPNPEHYNLPLDSPIWPNGWI